MSDWIERDGKKYFEESYLQLANENAKRATAENERLRAENGHKASQLRQCNALIGKIQGLVHEAAGDPNERDSDFDVLDQGVFHIIQERDRLRAELAAVQARECGLRSALEAIRAYIEPLAEPEHVYGFFHGGDPRNFHPDGDATEEERAAHKAACELFISTGEEAPSCCEEKEGVLITRAPFGLGVNDYTDYGAVSAVACINEALTSSAPCPHEQRAAEARLYISQLEAALTEMVMEKGDLEQRVAELEGK